MLVKCSWCQKNFNSERYGRQFCPHCGAELEIPEPGAQEAVPDATTLQPGQGAGAGAQRQQGAGATQYFDPWAQPGEPGAWPGRGGQQGGAAQPPGAGRPWTPGGAAGGQPWSPGQPAGGTTSGSARAPGSVPPGGATPAPGGWATPAGSGMAPDGSVPPGGRWNVSAGGGEPPGGGAGGGWATPPGGGLPPGGGVPPGGGWIPPAGGGFPPDGPPQDQDAPWERRGELGLVRAFVETWKQASLEPSRFFARLKPTGIGEAFLFGWICSTLGGLLAGVWNVPLSLYGDGDPVAAWAPVIGAPVLSALGLLVNALLLHLACMLLGAASRGFEGTMRVVGYAAGPSLLSVVPFVGGLAALVWTAVILIHGIAAMHRVTTGKATLAVVLPGLVLILCCGCGLGSLLAVGWGALMQGASPSL